VIAQLRYYPSMRGGIKVVIPTTTKSTAAERPGDSRDRDPDCGAFSVFRVFTNKFLRGWQYHNSRLACTAALSRTASDALESSRMYIRVCQGIQRRAKSVSRGKSHSNSHSGVVVEVHIADRQLSAQPASRTEKSQVQSRLARLCQPGISVLSRQGPGQSMTRPSLIKLRAALQLIELAQLLAQLCMRLRLATAQPCVPVGRRLSACLMCLMLRTTAMSLVIAHLLLLRACTATRKRTRQRAPERTC
jgi:hypothetical protein